MIGSNPIVTRKEVLHVDVEVVLLLIEVVALSAIMVLVIVSNDQGHEREGEWQILTEENPVVVLGVHSMAQMVAEEQLGLRGLQVLNLVGAQLDILLSNCNDLVFTNEWITLVIVEDKSFWTSVKGIELVRILNVPDDEALLAERLSDHNSGLSCWWTNTNSSDVLVSVVRIDLEVTANEIYFTINFFRVDLLLHEVKVPHGIIVPENHLVIVWGEIAFFKVLELFILIAKEKVLVLNFLDILG